MPLFPLVGHTALRQRLRDAVANGTLPASLLFQGPRGTGKQQLALWLGRLLLCERPTDAPCGECRSCRMAAAVQHPDLHWYFPRPRPKDASTSDVDDVREDMAEGIGNRLQNGGLYEAPGGDEGIFISTVHALVQSAALSPAMARRKVFVVGDADRMVAQEGADFAANAFLKLLEEPSAGTTIILTSSEPGALLPTIRSRVVTVRVAPLAADDMQIFLANAAASGRLDVEATRDTTDALLDFAAGAPGQLIGRATWEAALDQARRLLDAARASDRRERMRVALSQGGRGARGKFTDTLDALTVLLHERARVAARAGRTGEAHGAARAIAVVEEAKELASGNVNPQLLTSSVLNQIAGLVA